MAKRGVHRPVPVSDLITDVLDPVMRKRAGISVGLVQSWEEIVGPRHASTSQPQKIQWPRRAHEEDPFEPATLVIACEGLAALHIQHESAEIISRVNGFLGFNAIGRIRIVQKPVQNFAAPARPKPRQLSEAETADIARKVSLIEDDGLRASLERLGRSMRSEKSRKS
ncbi:MAG: DciA family protein [Rhizobiaceae bacterium]|nr:DciA family protein [Rhizobiaceae bacterium]